MLPLGPVRGAVSEYSAPQPPETASQSRANCLQADGRSQGRQTAGRGFFVAHRVLWPIVRSSPRQVRWLHALPFVAGDKADLLPQEGVAERRERRDLPVVGAVAVAAGGGL